MDADKRRRSEGVGAGHSFLSANSTFWRQTGGAIPGRVVNPTVGGGRGGGRGGLMGGGSRLAVGGGGGGGPPAHTFQDFQDSVSDAWEIEDEPLDGGGGNLSLSSTSGQSGAAPLTASGGGAVKPVASAAPSQQDKNKDARSSVDDSGLTPIHANSSGAVGRTNARSSNSQQISGVGRRSPTSRATPPPSSPHLEKEKSKCAKFEKQLAQSPVNMTDLKQLSWSGIPGRYRSRVWKMLCGYLPAGRSDQQGQVLTRKREEYRGYVNQYFNNKEEDIHKDTFRQIAIDVPRMSPLVSLFQQRTVQEMVERILYIWAIRHPASGYVQGINDLVTPFLMVFLQDHVPDKDVTRQHVEFDALEASIRDDIEADSFWCMSKVLDGIQDNYTFAQPGIQMKIRQLEELLKRVDLPLHKHIVGHEVQYLQFSFRWMNNLLLRELPLSATIRLWDTYLSEPDGFSKFHLYVCAAFLIRWKPDLVQKKDFQGILLFIQNVPTAKWNDRDISLLVAEAYKLKYMFDDAPSHLTECRITEPYL